MTVSAMYPTMASPGAVPTAATALAGATPVANVGTSLPTAVGLNAALNGAQSTAAGDTPESRAMQAAIAQMRAAGVPDAQINQQLLAMQAQSGAAPAASASAAIAAPTAAAVAHKATVAKKKVTAKKQAPVPATPEAKAKAKKAKAVAAAKAKAKAAAAAKAKSVAVANPAAAGALGAALGTQLPANATALPGGTVYTYADPNNPGVAGLAGLSPQQQLQLGIMPSGMANGLAGLGAQAEPQSNVTNQSQVDPGALLGITGLSGLTGYGGVPTLGAPIMGNTNVSKPATAPAAPGTPGAATGSQTVTNRNANANDGYSQGVDPYSSLYGGYGGYGGLGTMPYTPYNTGIAGGLYSPYGASVTGAAMLPTSNSGGIKGWFGRLFS